MTRYGTGILKEIGGDGCRCGECAKGAFTHDYARARPGDDVARAIQIESK